MNSGIYLITNITNGKVYVGSSKSLKTRRYTHFRDLRRGSHVNPHLLHAWQQCGDSAFHFAVLEYCPIEELLEREDWWINLLDSRSRPRGYNLWDAERHECSAETRAKLSAAGLNMEPGLKAKIAASKSEKLKGNENAKGKKHRKPRSEAHRAKISAFWRGRKRSEEQMTKLGELNRGNSHAKGHDGRWGRHTEAAKLKLSKLAIERERAKREARS